MSTVAVPLMSDVLGLLVSPSPFYPLSGDQRLGETSYRPDLTHKDESGQLGGTSSAPLTTHSIVMSPAKLYRSKKIDINKESQLSVLILEIISSSLILDRGW